MCGEPNIRRDIVAIRLDRRDVETLVSIDQPLPNRFGVPNQAQGKFVDAANFDVVLPTGVSTVSGYSIGPETGALAPVRGSPFTTDQNPNSIAITGQPVSCVE